ncbi:ATP-binding protein [Natranaerobius thermophilus]|uniref:AAA ATPase n=1 Tax=Natranaerobius thermophilus (strain ATCC BAA-1301 / DSM 18059 / JW/NM-WN-LF) TaxID=457570 RepID=B2A4S4_NATTJ|nr:ATP-binding protein [Natranaerobius thermophilus]ACB83846.1 AAA ATPase [Natranaerobius thermophilus JW/NM-WN-LF]
MSVEKNRTVDVFEYKTAHYTPQKIKDYAGNPLIEALPPILETDEEVIDMLYSLPSIDDHERNLSPLLKTHVIKRVKRFIQPLPIHINLESKISVLIRQSYLSRNPLTPEYKKRIKLLHTLKKEEEITPDEVESHYRSYSSTAECLFINGVSGMGKTTAVNRILEQYPQIIKHTEYKGQKITTTQIVWLKIDSPYDGSFMTLCRNIFQEIDKLLGTRWMEKYGYFTRSTSTMVMYLTTLLANYNVGLLVIDEIQNIYRAKKNDPMEMLDYFVTLTNVISVPILIIGTNRARNLFQDNFRLARRVQSDGYIEIANLKKDSPDWEIFIESLWEFNVLENQGPLTDELNDTFYELCQGVIAVAVMLLMFSQNRAISEGKKSLTTDIIKKTYKEDLQLIRPMIEALRSGDPFEIAKFDDITIDEEKILSNYHKDIAMTESVQAAIRQKKDKIESTRESINEKLFFEFSASGFFNDIKQEVMKKIINKVVESSDVATEYEDLKELVMELLQKEKRKVKKKPRRKNINPDNVTLISLYDSAIDKSQHPYDAFKREKLIKDPLDEFLRVD